MTMKKHGMMIRAVLLAAAVSTAAPAGALAAETKAAAESTATETRAAEVEAPAAKTELKDGDYMVEVTLEGGSGRASVTSPTGIRVKDGTAIAAVQFSSPNYDYMIVAGKQYKKLNDEGNSIFNIPILAFDEPFPVIADTTAMDKPHEIEYTLNFHTDTAQKVEKEDKQAGISPYLFGAGIVVFVLFIQKKMTRKP
ncbi:hypothetical protein SAMN04487771_101721 [[Clostridium] aminophilum]|uniref:Iron Transport-associated domain-containing protein n=2 Tax=[Clostridium] aminophilum TaxID=1526 RepID=A0A1I0E8W3_9FIRM|nr:hypothetical protein SAMN04487771_101721 [[Clostridium] aminophilum]